jgi:hypothetical protein
MGGPEMAPQTPQRSSRPGEAGALLDSPQWRAGMRVRTPAHISSAQRK